LLSARLRLACAALAQDVRVVRELTAAEVKAALATG